MGVVGIGLRRKISSFDSPWYLTTLAFFTRIKNDDIFFFVYIYQDLKVL